MKIYAAGYTRDSVLRTFSNLPREQKFILSELQMEKLSEGSRDGFLWRVHSNKMYSCTLVSFLWDKKLDERRIPLIVSYIMDKDAAEFIMEYPFRLLKVTEQLKRMTHEDVLAFQNADVMEMWEDTVKVATGWEGTADHEKVAGIVQAVIKMEVEDNVEFAGFVYGTKAEIFAALDILPMAFRMNFSFSFPFTGCGAAVCDINITDRETMQQSREKSYNGWPMVQRIEVSKELEISEKTKRVLEEVSRLHHKYGKFPFKERDAENLVRRLEMLSYLNEYNANPTKAVKKEIIKNKNKKLKIDELLKFIENPKSPELLAVLGKNTSKNMKAVNGNVSKAHLKAQKRKVEGALLLVMALLTAVLIWDLQTDVDMKTVYLFVTFEAETMFRYILVFLLGIFTGVFVNCARERREKE